MNSRTPSSAFEHDPLPDSTTHFRLLHILRGDFGQHVECEISSWPIDDAPSYYAISYTWGDPADTAEITVNGKPLVIRRNCEYVLQQAFATKASRHYWVDAICIAQTSIQERNHQVGIMGKIYSGAKHVFACVGPHADDSDYLMAAVDKRRPILETVHKQGQSAADYDVVGDIGYLVYESFDNHVCLRMRCLFTMRASERLRTIKAFVAFIRRPYFTRVWVLQELHLATRMSYCCGADVQPGESFRALDSLVMYWINRENLRGLFGLVRASLRRTLEICIPAYRLSNSLWESLCYELYRTVPQRTCLRLGASAQKQGLDEMLRLLRNFHCVDARDNLYGILSLVRWPKGQEPTPDYTKDNFEVAKQALSLWPRGHACYAFRTNCRRLFLIFGVIPMLQSLQDAIALRSSVASEADHRQHENRTSEFAAVSTMWRGIQISDDSLICQDIGDRGQPEPVSCYMERERNGRFVCLRISSTVSVCAPVDTKVGDWCLVTDGHFTQPSMCGLILRKSKDDEYTVVGPALAKCWNHELDHPLANNSRLVKSFIGWSDPEDLLVLAWTLDQLPYNRGISDKDMLEFVSMRVCGWKGSSCFEEILEKHVSR